MRAAWHLGLAASEPDEAVAARLEAVADDALERGGCGMAAAFRARAAVLTPDRSTAGRPMRGRRRRTCCSAAPPRGRATSSPSSSRTLDDQVQRGVAQRLHGQVRYATGEATGTVSVLVAAAEDLRDVDRPLARDTLLDALSAAQLAGSSPQPGESYADVARVARGMPLLPGSRADRGGSPPRRGGRGAPRRSGRRPGRCCWRRWPRSRRSAARSIGRVDPRSRCGGSASAAGRPACWPTTCGCWTWPAGWRPRPGRTAPWPRCRWRCCTSPWPAWPRARFPRRGTTWRSAPRSRRPWAGRPTSASSSPARGPATSTGPGPRPLASPRWRPSHHHGWMLVFSDYAASVLELGLGHYSAALEPAQRTYWENPSLALVGLPEPDRGRRARRRRRAGRRGGRRTFAARTGRRPEPARQRAARDGRRPRAPGRPAAEAHFEAALQRLPWPDGVVRWPDRPPVRRVAAAPEAEARRPGAAAHRARRARQRRARRRSPIERAGSWPPRASAPPRAVDRGRPP